MGIDLWLDRVDSSYIGDLSTSVLCRYEKKVACDEKMMVFGVIV